MVSSTIKPILNYINGEWRAPKASEWLEVHNPATQELIGRTPFSPAADVNEAAQAAQDAWPGWRSTPATERIQYLFKLKTLLEENIDQIARLITIECGKTLEESQAEMRRAIENVEVACGIPIMMQGKISEDIAKGIDEILLLQPLGVCAVIAPFNFPGMIPFWFLPYALACGNTYLVKPSERVPLAMQYIFQLIEQIQLPKGVLNLVNGGKETVDAILDHPAVRAISFVGSTSTALYIYRRAAEQGKRAQCQGGAKNPVVLLEDADVEMSTRILADSAFGCAGQRCLAASLAITVGSAREPFTEAIIDAALQRVVGSGLDPQVQMGPVINPESRERIESLVSLGVSEGAHILAEGRDTVLPGYERGNFIRPTVLDNVFHESKFAGTEIFGPVLGLIHARDLDEAIALINKARYGNMACIFTSSGAAARKFRYEVEAGNIGINIGVAAPMAFFPFSGWKDSFFGVDHGQSWDAVNFFTQKKVVIERWPKNWTRKF